MEIGFEDIRRELHSGNRVLVLVRHSERRKIDKEDPTFGESVPVTENGWRLSLDWGRALRGAAADVEFRASPLRRTVMTAEGIAEGMGLEGAAVVPDDLIGNGSAFFADRLEVWRQFRDRRFFEKMSPRGLSPSLGNSGEPYVVNGIQLRGDGVCDMSERSGDRGVLTLDTETDTYDLASKISPVYSRYGDDEVRQRFHESDDLTGLYDELSDWSDPGCQHENPYGPTVRRK